MAPRAGSTKKYEYDELGKGEIRLLELLPLNDKDLTGRIHRFTLPRQQAIQRAHRRRATGEANVSGSSQGLPEYDALSHHWGLKRSGQAPIISILGEDDKIFELEIREELKQCLEQLVKVLKKDSGRSEADKKTCSYIWVDAICINQDSRHDKSAQLPRMGDIYSGARRVIVWLGPEEHNSPLAMHFIEQLQNLDDDDFPSFESGAREVAEKWEAFAKLTRRRWFTRLWIVQEISAAKEAYLLCGDKWLSWDDFAGAVSLFALLNENIKSALRETGEFARRKEYLGEVQESGANRLVEAKNSVIRKRDDGTIAEHLLSLEALLTSLSAFEASEAHDVVYAVLWLSTDATPEDPDHPAPRVHSNNNLTPRDPNPRAPWPADHRPVDENHVELPLVGEDSLDTSRNEPFPSLQVSGVNPVNGLDPVPSTENTSRLVPHMRHSRRLSQQYLNVPATEVERQETAATVGRFAGGITVDYAAEVYEMIAQVLQHVIEKYKTLDLIAYPWAPPPQKKDDRAQPPRDEDEAPHPTWILPRTSRAFGHPGRNQAEVLRRANADPFVGRPGTARSYLACGRTKARAKIEDRCLIASGWWLEELSEVGDPANDAVIPFEWLEMIRWTNPFEQKPPDWFWRTLVGNKGPSGFNDPPPRFKTACVSIFRSVPERANLNLGHLLGDGKVNVVTKEYVARVQSVVFNRRLLIAKSSKNDGKTLYGLGPKTAQQGDKICILAGCSVPVLLRPVKGKKRSFHDGPGSDSAQDISPPRFLRKSNASGSRPPSLVVNGKVEDQTYTFVGECYIDGMMNGECFRYAEDRERQMEDFHII